MTSIGLRWCGDIPAYITMKSLDGFAPVLGSLHETNCMCSASMMSGEVVYVL